MSIEQLEQLKADGEDLSSPQAVLATIAKFPNRAEYLITVLIREHRDNAFLRGYDEGLDVARWFLPECPACRGLR